MTAVRAKYVSPDDMIYASFTATQRKDGSIDDDSVDLEFVDFCGERLDIGRQSRQLIALVMDLRFRVEEWEEVQ